MMQSQVQTTQQVTQMWRWAGPNKLAFLLVGPAGEFLLKKMDYPTLLQPAVMELPSVYSSSNRPDHAYHATKVLRLMGLPFSPETERGAELFAPPQDERTIVVCLAVAKIPDYVPPDCRWYTVQELLALKDSKNPRSAVCPVVSGATASWVSLIADLQALKKNELVPEAVSSQAVSVAKPVRQRVRQMVASSAAASVAQ